MRVIKIIKIIYNLGMNYSSGHKTECITKFQDAGFMTKNTKIMTCRWQKYRSKFKNEFQDMIKYKDYKKWKMIKT